MKKVENHCSKVSPKGMTSWRPSAQHMSLWGKGGGTLHLQTITAFLYALKITFSGLMEMHRCGEWQLFFKDMKA